MRNIVIGNQKLSIKDYYCTLDGKYITREDGKIWLYINITDKCNAKCPFCVNPASSEASIGFDTTHLKNVLTKIAPYIYGVSITGGEPMLFPELVDEVVTMVDEIFDASVEIDLVTNGTNIAKLSSLKMLDRFQSIHISRHYLEDVENSKLMRFKSPNIAEIRELVLSLEDAAKVVLNCVMQKGGIENAQDMASYLEMASWAGVRNVSFVGLILANDFCTENYVSISSIDLSTDHRFQVWNRFYDHSYCSCSSGDYLAENGYIRYYYRYPGKEKADYCRQLVYTSDNKLLDGFNGNEIYFDDSY